MKVLCLFLTFFLDSTATVTMATVIESEGKRVSSGVVSQKYPLEVSHPHTLTVTSSHYHNHHSPLTQLQSGALMFLPRSQAFTALIASSMISSYFILLLPHSCGHSLSLSPSLFLSLFQPYLVCSSIDRLYCRLPSYLLVPLPSSPCAPPLLPLTGGCWCQRDRRW